MILDFNRKYIMIYSAGPFMIFKGIRDESWYFYLPNFISWLFYPYIKNLNINFNSNFYNKY